MRQFTVILEQINHSKNLILENDTSSLRMALILLDNAAEILMYRTVLSEFRENEIYEKIREMDRKLHEKAKSALPSDIFDKFLTEHALTEHALPKILEEKKKKNILKYFDEKITFLCDTCGLISSPVSAVLSSLHSYRNETYHRDIIRNEILRPIAILYFELVCELVTYLKQGCNSYSSEDDWSQFFTKYGLGKTQCKMGMLSNEDIEAILNRFRTELSIDLHELRENLQKYVINRLDEILDRLNFISDALDIKPLNTTLKLIQFTQIKDSLQLNNILQSKEFNNYTAPITEEVFSNCRAKTHHFVNIDEKLVLFMAFKDVEDQFEPIEHKINDLADKLDAAIQSAINIARGK